MGLLSPKRKKSYRNVRLAAVEKLEDQDLLAKIVKNDKDKWILQRAVLKLEYQQLLADIAKTDKEFYVRAYVEERLKNLRTN